MKQQQQHSSRYMPIIIVLLFVLLPPLCEGIARLAFFYARKFVAVGNLNDYQVLDLNDRKLWRLRPGFTQTLEQAIVAKQKTGRGLAVEYLHQRAAKLGIRPQDVVFHINEDGFKGPELDKSHSHLRILTLGDSCTFGTLFDTYSYPRVLERELWQLGWKVEVVNGGVEGYGPRQVLARIEDFKALRPEFAIAYIGWNAIFSYDTPPNHAFQLYTPWLVRTAYRRLFIHDPYEAALSMYNRAKHPDKNDPELKRLDGYTPPFTKDVAQVIRQLQGSGTKVVLVTLPGLYTTKEEPSARALQIGHLPTFTTNPYVLAKIVEEYNSTLRGLAQQYGLQLIDLAQWSDNTLRPRDAYFTDAIHLYEEGQELIGKYLAQELVPSL